MMIEGQFFKYGTSQGEPAGLNCQGDSLVLVSERSSRIIDPDTLDISRRLANIPRCLTFPDGSMFTTPHNEQLDEALRSLGIAPKSSWIDYFESGWHWTLLALFVIPVFLYMLFTFGMPVVAGPMASWVPETVKQDIDAGAIDFLDEWLLMPSGLTTERREALVETFGRVSRFSPTKPAQILFRSGGALGANAMALPGGTIIFTDELVELAEHEGELVAVYVHELGHLANNHSMRNMMQTAGVTFVLGWMLGDLTMITDVVLVGTPVLMQQMSYTRGFEHEADEFAMMQLDISGYPGSCFADIIERLSKQHGREMQSETSYFSSHPAPARRVNMSRSASACADYQPDVSPPEDKARERGDHSELVDKPGITPPYLPSAVEEIEVDLSEGNYQPVVKTAPTYPMDALVRGIEGYCVVEYTVNTEGRIEDPVVLEDQCTSPFFHAPSLKAARSFRYKPRVENNQAVTVPGVQNKFTYEILEDGETPIDPPLQIPE